MFSANIPRLSGLIIVQFIRIQYIFIIWTGTLENLNKFIDELNDIHQTIITQKLKIRTTVTTPPIHISLS